MNNEKKYYSERKGLPESPIELSDLKLMIRILYEKYRNIQYFQFSFGYDCVDEGYVAGSRGVSMGEDITLRFLGRRIWPIKEYFTKYDEPTSFDLIEYLFDNIAKPTSSKYHEWNNCGIHVYNADYEEGRREFREEINSYLSRYKDGKYELTKTGEINEKIPQSLKKVVYQRPISEDKENIEDRIKRAERKFLHYDSNKENKKEAIRILADILEFLKPKIKEKMFSKDEKRLFEIANKFGIRHHNIEQQINYDKEIWFEWIFFAFLNTINTITKLINK